MTKLADFCGRGLVARQDRPTKSVNHDTADSFVCYFVRYQLTQQSNTDRKIILASFFLHLMNENNNKHNK